MCFQSGDLGGNPIGQGDVSPDPTLLRAVLAAVGVSSRPEKSLQNSSGAGCPRREASRRDARGCPSGWRPWPAARRPRPARGRRRGRRGGRPRRRSGRRSLRASSLELALEDMPRGCRPGPRGGLGSGRSALLVEIVGGMADVPGDGGVLGDGGELWSGTEKKAILRSSIGLAWMWWVSSRPGRQPGRAKLDLRRPRPRPRQSPGRSGRASCY